jgi:hypothetical protein
MGSLGFFFEYGEQADGHEDQSYKTGFGSTIPNWDDSIEDQSYKTGFGSTIPNWDDSIFVRAKSKNPKKTSKGFNRK